MATVQSPQYGSVFDQKAISAMSAAFDEVCTTMKVRRVANNAREAIAMRIIELASQGETDVARLRERMLRGWSDGVTGTAF